MSTDRARYTVSLDEELFHEVENFRYENRFPNRSTATVELIRRGLEAVKNEKAEQQQNEANK